jgi:hypothetical protein
VVSHLILELTLKIKIEKHSWTGAPLRNRTVDLLLTISTSRCDGRLNCTDATRERTGGTGRAGNSPAPSPRPSPRWVVFLVTLRDATSLVGGNSSVSVQPQGCRRPCRARGRVGLQAEGPVRVCGGQPRREAPLPSSKNAATRERPGSLTRTLRPIAKCVNVGCRELVLTVPPSTTFSENQIDLRFLFLTL